MSKGFASTYRISLVAGAVFAAFAGLGARLVQLHVVERTELLRSVEEARRQVIVQRARRGDILDLHGSLLATSRSVIVLGVDPQAVRPEDEAKWPRLAELAGVPLADVRRILTTRFRPAEPAAVPGAGAAAGKPSAGSTGGKGGASASSGIQLNLTGIENQAGRVAGGGGGVGASAGAADPAAAVEAVAAADGTAADGGAAADGSLSGAPAAVDDGASAGDDTVVDDPDETGRRPIRWARLADEVSESAYADIDKLGVRGVYGNRAYRRVYPDNELAAHVIGYVNREEQPVAGMEHYADFYLRGLDGWVESEKDGKARELAQFRTREVPPSDGYSVVLSIDSIVQHMAEDELEQIAQKYHPLKASIIISDPRTGFILAMANYPSFDPNAYNRLGPDALRDMRNVAVADQYEPGSVFKIVAASGALNEGLVTPQSRFDCTLQKIEYEGTMRSLPRENVGDHFVHPLSVAEILAYSSNKGAAQLAMRLGDQRFYGYARAFGFGQMTGFPVGGEITGSLRPPNRWDGLTITRMPMGQSVGATALQMHQAMGVIASGGVLLRPQVIRQVRDAEGNIVYRFDRADVRRVMTYPTARTMARLLQGVVAPDGTAPEAAIDGYEVAGKTGTANKLLPVEMPSGRTELRYSDRHHVASFFGFFPASRPQVEISVVVDDADAYCPGGVAYGAKVAAPVFKRLGLKLIPYLDIGRPDGAVTSSSSALVASARERDFQ